MTNAIEQTKREMYEHIDVLKYAYRHNPKHMLLGNLESSLEAHLEELRKAMVVGNEAIVACAQHSAESLIDLERRNDTQCETIRILQSRLEAMTEERDSIQLRLHAVDHAYSEQQRKAGTCGQVYADRGASEKLDGKTVAVLAEALNECQSITTSWAVDGLRAKKAIRAISAVVNGKPKVLRALLDLEQKVSQ